MIKYFTPVTIKQIELNDVQEGNLSYLESSDIQHVDNNEDEESDIQARTKLLMKAEFYRKEQFVLKGENVI